MTMTQLHTNNTLNLAQIEATFFANPPAAPAVTFMDVPRINADEKTFWMDQLESETYKDKQGKNALQTPDGFFCCLGVYCEAKEMPRNVFPDLYTVPDTDRERVKVDIVHYSDGERNEMAIIPLGRAIPWAETQPTDTCFSWGPGFTGDEDLFSCKGQDGTDKMPYGTTWSLPRLNDEGFTFAQIRDIINYLL